MYASFFKCILGNYLIGNERASTPTTTHDRNYLIGNERASTPTTTHDRN